jgi:hypothetical protein
MGQSRIDNPETLATLCTHDTGRRQTKQGQSRIDNPETLATLCTHDTGRRQTKRNTTQKTDIDTVIHFYINALFVVKV